MKRISFCLAFLLTNFLAVNVYGFDTSTIPATPSTPILLQSYEVYDFYNRSLDGSGVGYNSLFRCEGKTNVTLRNLTIRNTGKFALWIKGCSNLTVENLNLRDTGWGGIRLEKGTPNWNITFNNINGQRLNGHGIELWDTDGFTINEIRMDHTANCGVLVNNSRNGNIGRVWGTYNDADGGYATLRFANNAGPNIYVDEVVSRDSGRGFFTVSGSRGITVRHVNIARARADGIYLQDGSDNWVQGGSSRGSPHCRIRNNPGSYIGADCGGSIEN